MSSTDHQLLFGVLALQLELITVDQFVEACTVWASKKDRALPDMLFDRGWLRAEDKSDIDKLLARKIAKHGGDVAASLRDAGGDTRVRQSLLSIADDDIHRSLAPTPPPHGVAVVATRAFVPDGHDRYTLSRLHKTGGIGRVWLAHDVALRREVALKELRPERVSNDAILGRFLREARVTGQLEHPGIVPIYEVGERPDDHAPYYTMRFIRGQTMAEAAADYHKRRREGRAGPLELRKLLSAFIGVCNAIAYAHSRGVLHRDLKPQNVVMGGFGEVIVLDWGLARVSDEDDVAFAAPPVDLGSTDGVPPTRVGQTLGTPAYMSPEQAAGRLDLLGPATDVYGLGAILYHLLTDQPPFPGEDQDEVIDRVIKESVKSPREIVAETPAPLDAICLKALAKAPEDRYPSASAVAEEIQHWLADEPVQVFPEPLYVRAGRWMRRHKAFVSAAAVFLVCSSLALAGASVMFYREQQAAKREEEAAKREQQATERHYEQVLGFITSVTEYADRKFTAPLDSPLRGVHLARCLDLLSTISRERPKDPRIAPALARLKLYQSTALRVDQRYREAETTLKEAVALLEPFVAEHPENIDAIDTLAKVHFYLGALQKDLGRRRDALISHRRAIALTEGRAVAATPEARFNRVVATNEVSIVQFGMEPLETTRATVRQVVEGFRELIAKRPASETLLERLFLSAALVRDARCLKESGRPREALPVIDDAEREVAELAAVAPENDNVKHFRAIVFSGRGWVVAAVDGRLGEALAAYDRAIAIWKEMGNSRNARHNIYFATELGRRADLRRRLKRPDASADLDEAEKVLTALPAASASSVDFHLARAIVAGSRARLARDRNDGGGAAKAMEVARAAYQEALRLDPDNSLEKKEFEKLEADVRSASS